MRAVGHHGCVVEPGPRRGRCCSLSLGLSIFAFVATLYLVPALLEGPRTWSKANCCFFEATVWAVDGVVFCPELADGRHRIEERPEDEPVGD